jgi:mannose-6-phosphate isomerase-like protein (cupin superfamily)
MNIVGNKVTIVRGRSIYANAEAVSQEAHRAGTPPVPSYGLSQLTGGRASSFASKLPVDWNEGPQMPPERRERETGWHYHDCDLQLAFVLDGSIEIAVSDDDWRRYYSGDILVIPGGAPHNARLLSEDYSQLDLTMPYQYGTTPCPPHPRGDPAPAFIVGDADARPVGADGVREYDLQPHVAKIAIMRLIETGEDAVRTQPGALTFTYVRSGRCDVEAGGELDQLTPFDMLVDDATSQRATLLRRSPDFRAYQVQLRT